MDKIGKNDLSRPLLITVTCLITIGLIAICASSALKGTHQFGDTFVFLRKQFLGIFVGCLAIFTIQKVPKKFLENATIPLLIGSLFLLALVFIPGMYHKVGGAKRWLAIPYIGGQPSELAKLALVFFLAKNLSRPSADIDSFWRGVAPNICVFLLFAGLIAFQRDFGTPALLAALTFWMLFLGGLKYKFLSIFFGIVSLAATLLVIFEPYRMKRLASFLDPWGTLQGGGYQLVQSFIAFKNGGLFGLGLGESKQKLFFLPAAETDFILSVIGEELGLLGVITVCALFLYLGYLGFMLARRLNQPFYKFLAFGLTFILVVQSALNISVTMGLLPTKGIALPFISAGKSSLIVFMISAGLLIRLAKDQFKEEFDDRVKHL